MRVKKVNTAKLRRIERKQEMTLRLLQHLGLSKSSNYGDLPIRVQEYFSSLSYADTVRPLVQRDYNNGTAVRMLGLRYGVSETTIRYYLSRDKSPNADFDILIEEMKEN